jgi:hypothetical protein
VLAEHLRGAPKNACYTSKTIQNELIGVIGQCLQEKILSEVKTAKHYAILADEVTDISNMEQISIVLRYVNTDTLEPTEAFVDFVSVERITGESIAKAILGKLQDWGLDLKHLRGQSYDGASNMSGAKNGCQALIMEKAPLGFYVHCASHQLNLALVNASNLPEIRNAHSTLGEISRFFGFSPKRQRFLEKVVDASEDKSSATKLKDVCRTRWVERIDAYSTFISLYPFLITAFEAMTSPNNYPQFGDWNWDCETLSKANGFNHVITSPVFLVAVKVVTNVLVILRGLTVKLQGRSMDVLKVIVVIFMHE